MANPAYGCIIGKILFPNQTSLIIINLANASGWQVLHDESIPIDEVGTKSIDHNSFSVQIPDLHGQSVRVVFSPTIADSYPYATSPQLHSLWPKRARRPTHRSRQIQP